jgi:hypothetical protein
MGSISIPSCAQFQTGVSAVGENPTHLHLTFTILKLSANCASETMTPAPFRISYSPTKTQAAVPPVLDTVEINNAAAAFSVVEVNN